MGGQAKRKKLPLRGFGFSSDSVLGLHLFLFTCGCGFEKCLSGERERRTTLGVGRHAYKATLW